jgi:hypothetical protein
MTNPFGVNKKESKKGETYSYFLSEHKKDI